MKNASYPYYAMAGFYRTAVAVSALILSSSFAYAADPPVPRGNVSVTVNPTTGYYSTSNTTLRLPDGVRATPAAGATTVTKYAGGLQQSIPTGITIDAIKKSAPLPTVVRATTQSVKNAATGCLKSARCNVGLMLAGAGLQALFDNLDWVMGEGGKVQKIVKVEGVPEGVPEGYQHVNRTGRSSWDSPCPVDPERTCFPAGKGGNLGYLYYSCFKTAGPWPLTGFQQTGDGFANCYYGGTRPDISEPKPVPVSDADIDSAVNSKYTPEPSDWPALTSELQLDSVEITSAPTLKGEPITTTVYDADGVAHEIKETNIWYDFDIRNNGSSQPALDLKVREETKTYNNGALTGTTTTETTQPSVGVGVVGGGGQAPTVEIPTDCDFHPTLCKWLDWTKEEPEEPDDNLSNLLKEVPIASKTFTISGGAAACPAPLVLNLSQFGSREVSYQPLCDLASTMKYLYLALMSFAAAVLLNRSINRV